MSNATGCPIDFPFRDTPKEGEAIEIAPSVLWMRLPLPMVLDHVNVFAFEDADGWTIIDTGFDSKRTRRIWERLLSGPLGGKPVARVIITHHHPDHIGLAGWFQQEHGAELITSRTAWLFARMLQLDDQATPPEETLTFWRAAGMHRDILEERKAQRPFNYADIVAHMPLGFKRIKEGDQLQFGGRNWSVHMGNGHAPEHVTLWSDQDDLVIGGDQLLGTISPNLGVYATEPDADPVGDWLEASQRLKQYATPAQLVLPGHKLPFTGLPTRLNQLIQNHQNALARLEDFLQTPHVATACFVPLFKREITGGEYGHALVEAVGHLNHLLIQGRVTRQMQNDGAWLWQKI